MSYYCNDSRLIPGKGHSITERDEAGNIIGAYTGYWSPGRRLVTLYPDYKHPAVKPGVKLQKWKIYDGMVKCRQEKPENSTNNAKGSAVKSQTSRAMKDIIGQIGMKF